MVEIALSVLPTTNRDDYPRGSKRRLAAACRTANLPDSTLRLPRQRLGSMVDTGSQSYSRAVVKTCAKSLDTATRVGRAWERPRSSGLQPVHGEGPRLLSARWASPSPAGTMLTGLRPRCSG
ncbi:MAG: hypothetical protein RLZZ450_2739 [Pseudomonadota bacterium]|jgi:hypothetical protein